MRERIIQDTLRLYEEEVDLSTLESMIKRELVRDENETDPQYRFFQRLMGVNRTEHELKQSILNQLRSAKITAISLRTLQNLSTSISLRDVLDTTEAKFSCESIMSEVRGLISRKHIANLQANPDDAEYLAMLEKMAVQAEHVSQDGEVYVDCIVADLLFAFEERLDQSKLEGN